MPAIARYACLAILLYTSSIVVAQSCDPAAPTLYLQDDTNGQGIVSMEAELFTQRIASRRSGHGPAVTWTIFSDPVASNAAYINVPTVNEDALDPSDLGAEVSYDITFTKTGTHYLWMRYIAVDNDARSFHLLLDGAVVRDDVTMVDNFTNWQWRRRDDNNNLLGVTITSVGTHRLTVRHREDGMKFDKFILTTDINFTPGSYTPYATAVRTPAPKPAGTEDVTFQMDHRTGHSFAVVEAEHPHANWYGAGNLACLYWDPYPAGSASNDSMTMVATQNRVATAATVWGSPRMDYTIRTDRSESLYLYLRHRGTAGNSAVNVRVNNGPVQYFDVADGTDYQWESMPLGNVVRQADGTFTLSLLMHEDGTVVDKLLVTTDPDYAPSAKGPLETILNPNEIVYYQQDSPGYPVELPVEIPSQNLGGYYLLSGLQWKGVSDAEAMGGAYTTVPDPLGGLVKATGIQTDYAPTIEFEIDFIQSGFHNVYTRHRSPSNERNGYAIYLDGAKVTEYAAPVQDPNTWSYATTWPQINVGSPGRHTFSMAMTQSGTQFDHVVISQQPAGSAVVLPAELLHFTGVRTAAGNRLNWTTASERDVDHFSVERSADGLSAWREAGRVGAVGNSSAEQDYAFTDHHGTSGGYYRLRTVDTDGHTELSAVVRIAVASVETVALYPNPAVASVRIAFTLAGPGTVYLTVSDMRGVRVARWTSDLRAGDHRVDLPLDELAAGPHMVSLWQADRLIATQQLIKQ